MLGLGPIDTGVEAGLTFAVLPGALNVTMLPLGFAQYQHQLDTYLQTKTHPLLLVLSPAIILTVILVLIGGGCG